MTRDQARRAAILADAMDEFVEIEKALKRKGPDSGYTRLVGSFSIQSDSEVGSETHAEIMIDMETARLLWPAVRQAILGELSSLGIEVHP